MNIIYIYIPHLNNAAAADNDQPDDVYVCCTHIPTFKLQNPMGINAIMMMLLVMETFRMIAVIPNTISDADKSSFNTLPITSMMMMMLIWILLIM